jgi:pimeloyl-ACP methyl ester carboxylesterase
LWFKLRATLCLALCLCANASFAANAQPASESFRFASVGAVLGGTLVVPSHSIAAVVLVPGSGQTPRMLGFARALAKQGIAALTYDKRGVGESSGLYAGPEVGTNNVDPPNLQLLAGDAASAVRELMRRLPPDHGPVGIIGFSQGGWIVPLAAKMNADIQFMVLWSGPLVTTHEQLRFQFFTEQKPDFWEHHTEAQAREQMRTAADRYQFIDDDPLDALKDLSIPGLWLFGGRDVNVPVKLSIERLEALKADGKPFEYQEFPASGHNLDEKDAFPATIAWIKSRASPPP